MKYNYGDDGDKPLLIRNSGYINKSEFTSRRESTDSYQVSFTKNHFSKDDLILGEDIEQTSIRSTKKVEASN
jgi:hypothetical protein